ncbi:hypothetical protein ACFY8W_19805 [Streptomyces sp. NPDC012637]|uniref:hypothetical protein n=1 Tax=Streptomyces sp. NPDC012637 TaxID=3364842 RepID=UPI0036E8B6CE
MNRLTFWVLLALCVAVEVLGLLIDRRDIHCAGAVTALGVIAVARLLYLARKGGGGEE